jgi:hypothetical protein
VYRLYANSTPFYIKDFRVCEYWCLFGRVSLLMLRENYVCVCVCVCVCMHACMHVSLLVCLFNFCCWESNPGGRQVLYDWITFAALSPLGFFFSIISFFFCLFFLFACFFFCLFNPHWNERISHFFCLYLP